MTNNLEYYVPESERALRALHLPRQFAQAEVEGKRKRERNAKNIWTIRGGGRARRYKSYYVEHASAEMSTVLRKQAPILIRLREKLGLQLCTVFHSTLYAIIQTRNAPKLRLMQNRTTILCNDTCTRQAEFMHKTEIRNSAHVA